MISFDTTGLANHRASSDFLISAPTRPDEFTPFSRSLQGFQPFCFRNRAEFEFRRFFGNVYQRQNNPVYIGVEVTVEFLARLPLLHQENGIRIIQILLKPTTDATGMNLGWSDNHPRGIQEILALTSRHLYPQCDNVHRVPPMNDEMTLSKSAYLEANHVLRHALILSAGHLSVYRIAFLRSQIGRVIRVLFYSGKTFVIIACMGIFQ